ncbi:hypothetical protein EVAR_49488_1 [Eumeta japonica]|uniref:PiggyBac transposable element-derived protein domain-containing protein n=1 Tax=Eumeta variegata TaxID=151549 RepID=A0A4C1VWP1_EUMVA|nr:hypothetical protein EVAR_49488_1 [Eumeta japonica]
MHSKKGEGKGPDEVAAGIQCALLPAAEPHKYGRPYEKSMKPIDGVTNLGSDHLMNQFSKSRIAANLLWLKNTIIDTVMPHRRGLTQEWRHQELEVNEMVFSHRSNMTACKWKKRRDVYFITTQHTASWAKVTIKAKKEPTK